MSKPFDLGVRPPASKQPIPSFRRQQRTEAGPIAVTPAIPLGLFNPNCACTVQYILIQASVSVMVQLLLNGQPFGMPINITAATVVRFAGTVLVNNESLSLSVSGNTNITFEVVWMKDFHPDLIVPFTDVYTAGNVISGSVTVTPASNDAPIGTETATITRSILRKLTTIESTTPLGANGVFTGPWHDSELDGTVFVTVTIFSNVAAAGNGLVIQETDDQSNANFTRSASLFSGAINANALTRIYAIIKARYWRVVFTNGAGAQASFECTSTACNMMLASQSQDGGGLSTSLEYPIVLLGSQSSMADNANTTSLFCNFSMTSGTANTPSVLPQVYTGAFSGTANATKQGWSRRRTPSIFKQVSTAATGSTVLWTPGNNNKFRLMRFKIQVTGDAKLAVAADVTIKLLDAAADIGVGHIVFIPAAAGALLGDYDSGWIDLGEFGFLSATANNALNINLSAALTGGLVNVIAAGTEE